MQQQAIAAEKFDNCEPNGVWTPWGPGREDAVRPIIAGRGAKQFEPLRAIESPKDDKMRKSLDIGKPKPKFRQDLKRTLCLVFRTQPLRNFYILCVGATHKPDRYWRKHDEQDLTSYRDLPQKHTPWCRMRGAETVRGAVTNPNHRPAVGHRRLAVGGPAEARTITGSGRRR